MGMPWPGLMIQTLRLLLETSPDEVEQHFNSILEGIERSGDLGSDGIKAVEIIEVQSSSLVAASNEEANGALSTSGRMSATVERAAHAVFKLFGAMRSRALRGTNEEGHWEEGFRRVLAMVNTCTSAVRLWPMGRLRNSAVVGSPRHRNLGEAKPS